MYIWPKSINTQRETAKVKTVHSRQDKSFSKSCQKKNNFNDETKLCRKKAPQIEHRQRHKNELEKPRKLFTILETNYWCYHSRRQWLSVKRLKNWLFGETELSGNSGEVAPDLNPISEWNRWKWMSFKWQLTPNNNVLPILLYVNFKQFQLQLIETFSHKTGAHVMYWYWTIQGVSQKLVSVSLYRLNNTEQSRKLFALFCLNVDEHKLMQCQYPKRIANNLVTISRRGPIWGEKVGNGQKIVQPYFAGEYPNQMFAKHSRHQKWTRAEQILKSSTSFKKAVN